MSQVRALGPQDPRLFQVGKSVKMTFYSLPTATNQGDPCVQGGRQFIATLSTDVDALAATLVAAAGPLRYWDWTRLYCTILDYAD